MFSKTLEQTTALVYNIKEDLQLICKNVAFSAQEYKLLVLVKHTPRNHYYLHSILHMSLCCLVIKRLLLIILNHNNKVIQDITMHLAVPQHIGKSNHQPVVKHQVVKCFFLQVTHFLILRVTHQWIINDQY